MGLFDDVKRKAVSDANAGRKPWDKDPSEMSDRRLDRELTSNKSIFEKKKYAEEKLRRMGK